MSGVTATMLHVPLLSSAHFCNCFLYRTVTSTRTVPVHLEITTNDNSNL